MFIGIIIYTLFVHWLFILNLMLFSYAFILIKTIFLCFFLLFATTYLFFLLYHQQHIVHIRKQLAIEINRSICLAILMSSIIIAIYETILSFMKRSDFFQYQDALLDTLTTAKNPYLFLVYLSGTILLLSALCSHTFITPLLASEKETSYKYAYAMLSISILCWLFLIVIL